jgi:hypothetical protein
MARTNVKVGDVFGRLTVVRQWGKNKRQECLWLCQCECGAVRTVVKSGLLNRGNTKSCGCLAKDVTIKRNTSHGKTGSRVYTAWQNMLRRCSDPKQKNYQRYGGRGVTVCDEWDPLRGGSFEAFYAFMGDPPDGLSLDKDVRGGIGCLIYSPETCSWQDRETQATYTRQTRWLTLDGVKQTIAQWAEDLGMNRSTITYRLKRGWSLREALLTPKGGDRTQYSAS